MKHLGKPILLVGTLLLLAGGLLLPLWARAQAGTATYVAIRSLTGFPTLQAYVMVADQSGRPLRGVTAGQFTMEEDSQVITTFTVQEIERREPISVVLAIDTSGSMSGQPIADVKSAAENFVTGLEPGDQVALLSFNAQVQEESDYSGLHGALLEAVSNLQTLPPGTGATLLYQAAFDAVQKAAEGPLGHRFVLLLTDGEDVDSPVTLDDVINFAQRKSVPLFVVVIDNGRNSAFVEKMQRLATETGGVVYRVERGNTAGLSAEFAAILALLKWQYEITYTSRLPEDGQTHTLRVRVCQAGGQCATPGEATFVASQAVGTGPVPTVAVPPAPPQIVLDVIVFVDENNNNVWEPDEGISDVNVRIVDPRKNETVVVIRTDAVGHANFPVFMDKPMRLIVYYIGGFAVEINPAKPPSGPIVLRVPPVALPGTIP